MERVAWHDVLRESMVETWALIAEHTEGGEAVRRDGVFASVVPASPDRSVVNSVIYSDPEELLARRDELDEAYRTAGVNAWTVWVPEDDRDVASGLERAGHTLDAEPRAMGVELDGIEEPDIGDLDWRRDPDLAVVGRLNDAAYGLPDGELGRIITSMPPDIANALAIDVDGETAAVMMAFDAGDDTEIAWVATSAAARGKGLATALMRQSLWDARERGQRTATLQATRLGAGVYSRVGFEDLGALQMWERRR